MEDFVKKQGFLKWGETFYPAGKVLSAQDTAKSKVSGSHWKWPDSPGSSLNKCYVSSKDWCERLVDQQSYLEETLIT